MVKVTIRHVRSGVAGASGLLLLGGAAGCAMPAQEDAASSQQAGDTVVNPGTGTFELAAYYSSDPYGPAYSIATTNSTDEFVRVGERVTLQAPEWLLWTLLDEQNEAPDVARIKNLSVTFHARFLKKGVVEKSITLAATTWTGDQVWNLEARTAELTIPPNVDTVAVGLTVVDPAGNGGAGKTVEINDTDVAGVPVFGGELPNKHVVFDNQGQTLRNRVIEGGNPLAQSQLGITYTDWRADTLVDKSFIDAQIGTATSYSRFGTIEIPIYGEIQYEVSYGAAFDGYWQNEQPLPQTTTSRVLKQQGRTAYEATIFVPSYPHSLDMYFHVKAFLVVDYSRYAQSVKTRRYTQGDRILVREKWDNAGGRPGANYDFPIGG